MPNDLGKVGFILDGGGYTGARTVGFLKAVQEAGVHPHYIQGVSVGASIAAGFLAAGGDIAPVIEMWEERIEKNGPAFVFPFRRALFRTFDAWLLSHKGLREILGWIDISKVFDSRTELQIIAWNEGRRRQEIFSNHDHYDGDHEKIFSDVIIASMSVPGLFPPVPIERTKGNKHFYTDGQSFLLRQAFRFGCDTVFVFLNDSENGRIDEDDAVAESLAEAHALKDLWVRRLIENRFILGKIVNDREFELAREWQGRVVPFFLKKEETSLSVIGFRSGDIVKEIRIAYERGKEIIGSM